MTLAIRFIGTYLNWEILPEDMVWLQKDEIPADPLSDLRTKKNALSVFLINDDKTDLNRCIAAFATCKSRGYVREIDYLLFDETLIRDVGIKYRQVDDKDIIDEKIRRAHWNLFEISSQKLITLAKKVMANNSVDTLRIEQVCKLISESINNGWVQKQDINGGIDKDLKKFCKNTV